MIADGLEEAQKKQEELNQMFMHQIAQNLNLQPDYLTEINSEQLRLIDEKSFYEELNLKSSLQASKEAVKTYKHTEKQKQLHRKFDTVLDQIKSDAEQTAAAEGSEQTASNANDLDSIKDLIKNREMPDKEREILMMMHQIAELEQLLSRQSDGLQDSQEEVISLLR